MKYPIIHTDFIGEVIEELNLTAYNNNCEQFEFTYENLFDSLDWAQQLIQMDLNRLLTELNELEEDCDRPDDLLEEVESIDRLAQDLSIVAMLEDASFAHPFHISSAIATLSEHLVAHLDAIVHPDYFCKKLAEVLSELCQLIKEV